MAYWIMKTEPSTFSIDDLMRDGKTVWDGVRSYEARNNLRKMSVGDMVYIYHSMTEKSIVGLAKVSRAAFEDPTDETGTWSSVEIVPVGKLENHISLKELKENPVTSGIPLVKKSRLSVSEIPENVYFLIEKQGKIMKNSY